MKQNFSWVNYDKEEYINALEFDEEGDIRGYLHNSGSCSNTLISLLAGRWINGRILLIGEKLPERNECICLSNLRKRFDGNEYQGNAWFGVQSEFTDISTLPSVRNPDVEGAYYRYVINHGRKEYYRRRSLKDRNVWFNPLSYLMIAAEGYTNDRAGIWLDDLIQVSNDRQYIRYLTRKEKFRNMTGVYTREYFLGDSKAPR